MVIFQGSRYLSDHAGQILEVSIAFDWIDKLCTCRISKEEGRLVLTLTIKKIMLRILSNFALSHHFLKELDLSSKFAAHSSWRWLYILWISL